VPCEALEAWSEATRGEFAAQRLPGGHFFLQTSERAVLELVARELARERRPAV